MTTNERIIKNILLKLEKINNDDTFKERYPNITAQEYLYARVHNNIKLERLIRILNGKAKKITLNELCNIAKALNIKVSDLVK